MMTAAVTLLSLVVGGWAPTPDEEVRFWAAVHGVDPAIALAVHDVESGQAPESRRDLVVSQGNYGRFQVRCTTWRPYFGLRACSDLLDRHRNIRLGVRILRLFQDRFASRNGRGCRCSNPAGHHWIAHYNEGMTIVPGGRGERYGRLVASRARRLEKRARPGNTYGPASAFASRFRTLSSAVSLSLRFVSTLGRTPAPQDG